MLTDALLNCYTGCITDLMCGSGDYCYGIKVNIKYHKDRQAYKGVCLPEQMGIEVNA